MNQSRLLTVAALAVIGLFKPSAHAAPAVSAIVPAPGSTVGSLTSVSVTFSEPVVGVSATDLGINGEVPATVNGSGAGPYLFSFPEPPAGLVTFTWDVDQSIAGVGTGLFEPGGAGGSWTYTLTDSVAPTLGKIRTSVAGQEMDDVRPARGATVATLTQAVVTFSESVSGVGAADLLINGSPATAVTGSGSGPYVFDFPSPSPGAVSFTWAVGHGIADAVGNAFAGTGWSVTVGSAGSVAITEFLVRNGGTAVMAGADTDGVRDENWDLSPWIELQNTGTVNVDLVGWSLTDDPGLPAKWVFPSRTVPVGGRLVVFASEKDRKPAAGNLHTNFALAAEGGSLYLFPPQPGATAASAWADFPAQRYDYSYGTQSTDGAVRFFNPPTVLQGAYTLPSSDIGGTAGTIPPSPIGQPNGVSPLLGVMREPHASIARGFFDEPIAVVLSSTEPGAAIRYTLDGSPPLISSTLYGSPIAISSTTVLRMAAFGTDKIPSRTVTHTYLYADQVVNQASPPYDNPASTTDNANPQPPAPGGSPLPIAWGISGTFTAVQTLAGFPTGTAAGSNNLTAGQIPADYGMDPKVYADPTKYADSGAVDAASGKTNLERIRAALRRQPALSLVMKASDMFGTYPNGQATSAAAGNPAAPLYPNSSAAVKTDMTKACSLELIEADGNTVFVSDAGIDLHGNASRDPFKNPKHGFTIRFKGKYGAGKVSGRLFPDSPIRDWDKLVLRGDFGGSWLHQNGTDGIAAGSDNYQRPRGIRIREAFCKDSFRDMGRVASHNRFCNLFINGVCWGSYELMEDEAEDFAASYLGGNKDDYDVVDQGKLKSGSWDVWSSVKLLLGWTGGTTTTDRTTPPTNYLTTFNNGQYQTLGTMLDLPWFADYMIWQTFAGHRDWATDASDAGKYMKNVYFFRPKGSTFKAMPWDMENLLWHESEDRVTAMTTFATAPTLFPPAVIHPRVKTNAEYRQLFADRVWRHMVRLGGALTPTENIARLNKWVTNYGVDEVVLESARWGDYRYKVHPYTLGTVNQVYTWNGAWYDDTTTAQYNGSWASGALNFNTGAGGTVAGRRSQASLGTYAASMSNAWYDEIRRLSTVYFPARTANVLVQYRNNGLYPFLNAPELRNNATNQELGDSLVAAGTQVKLVMPAAGTGSSLGDVYFTTDGTDPRTPFDLTGTPRAGATLYSTPIVVNGTTVIKARALAKPGSFPQKGSVRAASTANVTVTYAATGGPAGRGQITAAPNSLDGLTLAVGDRLLLKNQSAAAQNGIWVVTAVGTGVTGVWDRAADWDADGEVLVNTWIRVTAGTQNQDSLWRVTNVGTIVVGGTSGTSIVFASTGFSPWSALLEISLTVGAQPPAVRITEINYRPVQGGQAAEFVEIQNIGSAAVDVSNWYFDGIQFVFPHGMVLQPGARAVVASNENPATFATLYPGVVVTGYFGGSLDNGGERVDLFDRDGVLVTSVEYDNSQPWPTAAAGGGYSLEIVDPAGDPQNPANWRASVALRGTPGTANGTPALPAVRISEFFLKNSAVAILGAYPQFIELENFGLTPVDISAWQLAAGDNGSIFVFPVGTVLSAGQRAVVYSSAQTLPGHWWQGPRFSVTEGEIYLRTNAGAVADGVRYGNQADGVSFSRSGSGWVLAAPSPGAAQGTLTQAPITNLKLNEWLAAPGAGDDEFVELFNQHLGAAIDVTGLMIEAAGRKAPISAPTAIAPLGRVLLKCDAGSPHGDAVPISLPSSGAGVTIRHPDGTAVDTVAYGAQATGISQGRLPDGAATITVLGYPSPGQVNHGVIVGPQINELLLINGKGTNSPWATRPPWFELKNPLPSALLLDGWSVRGREAGTTLQHTFPNGVVLGASGGLLAVWSDVLTPESVTAAAHLNLPVVEGGSSASPGWIELVNPEGQIVDRVEWGRPIADRAIGRLATGVWAVLETPTRGLPNAGAAALGSPSAIRINEWDAYMDWVELHNPTAQTVDLGSCWLTDDPSEGGRRKSQLPPFTLIGPSEYAVFKADAATPGPGLFSFDLDLDGEYFRLSQNDGAATAVDAVAYAGNVDLVKTQGRLPDDTGPVGLLFSTAGANNYGGGGGAPYFSGNAQTVAVSAGYPAMFWFDLYNANSSDAVWWKDGVPLPGTSGPLFGFSAARLSDDGVYTCVATTAGGTTVSPPVRVLVLRTYDMLRTEMALSADGAGDADGDGLTDMAEFLAGTDPRMAASPAERLAVHQGGAWEPGSPSDFLSMTLRVDTRAAFSDLTGELSPDLIAGTWIARAPDSVETLSTDADGSERRKLKFSLPPGAPRQFLRIRVSR